MVVAFLADMIWIVLLLLRRPLRSWLATRSCSYSPL
jgi:hypothetical protein